MSQSQRITDPEWRQERRWKPEEESRKYPAFSSTIDSRSSVVEKELMDSQNRKLYAEISTLKTENKLLKEKYNRAEAKITELEHQLASAPRTDGRLTSQSSLFCQNVEFLQGRVEELSRHNDELKSQVCCLERQLDKAWNEPGTSRENRGMTAVDANQQEVNSVKAELQQVKALLAQSEKHVEEEEERCKQAQQQILRLTEINRLIQQQLETGVAGDTQIKSLEKRLKITEERLHQERADRANNLSQVEEKLLSENARLQSAEKELNRQLQREKDRCHSFEQRIKDAKDENDKLRLSMPFDEATLLSPRGSYDIPYGIHGSQRLESRKYYGEYKYIMTQVEKQHGLKSGQEKDIICELWSKKQHACHQLQELQILLQDLDLEDNNFAHGLKMLRDERSQCEVTVNQIQEKLQDAHQARMTIENTYKEKLSELVREKHEAAAQLKSKEDLVEAIRSENQILKQAVTGKPATVGAMQTLGREGGIEMFNAEIKNMENKIAQLTRRNNLLEGEVTSLTSQLEARTRALEAAESEVQLVNKRFLQDDDQDKKQQRINELHSEVDALHLELKTTQDKLNSILGGKSQIQRSPELPVQVRDHITRETAPSTYTQPALTESASRSSVDMKQISGLEHELSEREQEIVHLTHQNHKCQQHLQQREQDLNQEHARSLDFEAKVEGLQQQVDQKNKMLDAVSGQDKEQLAQFQVFRNTLDSLSQELSQTHAKLKVAQTGLSQEKDKAARYRTEVESLKRQSGKTTDSMLSENFSIQTQQIKELELEREQTKEELLQANMIIEEATEKLVACQKEMKQLKEDLATDKSNLLQVTAEKGELEQKLEELAEEHDAAIQEKGQTETDLIKIEYKMKEVLHQMEREVRQHQNPEEQQPTDMSPEMKKMASEMESLNVVISGKDKELGIAQDRINGHRLKMDLLLRRVDLLHKENNCNREDIGRLTNELALKVKESVANREVNQFLVSERAKLQKDNYQLEKNVEKEKSVAEQRKSDAEELAKKVDKSLDNQKSLEKVAVEKDNVIVSIESELTQANKTITQLEMEKERLKSKLEQTRGDLQNMGTKNETLEKQLEVQREALASEKSVVAKIQDDLISAKDQLENQKQEKSALISGLTSERQTTEKFKDDLQSRELECDRLRERIQQLEQNLQQRQEEINTHLDTMDQMKKDKSVIYQEYEGLCRRLSEKDNKMSEMQIVCDKTKDDLQKDYLLKQSSLEKEKSASDRELEFARAEITNLNDRIHQLDIQIATFGRTLQELEQTKREKSDVEAKLRLLESSSGDMRVLMESHRHEIQSLQETNANLQDKVLKEETTNIALREEQRLQKETSEKEIQDMKEVINNMKNQHDGEKRYLQEAKDKAETRIHALETSLGNAVEMRDKQQVSLRLLEKTEEDLNRQLQGEAMAHKLAVEKAETVRSQLEESRREKWATDDKVTKAEATVIKQKEELKTTKDRIRNLTEKCHELEATSYGHESSAKAKQEQLDLIVVENKKLRQVLDNQKQQLGGRLKRAETDLKTHLNNSEENHTKLSQQVQQLTSNLEKAREQISEKSLENLKLQEDILSLEDKTRESSIRLKEAQESLRMETEMQSSLRSRFQEQEDELKTLKTFLSKKAEEAGDADKSTWNEMSHLIQDLSHRMQNHFDSQKTSGQDEKERESQLSQRYRSRLSEIETELSTEKALHQITRNSMQSLEEDCQRLRHQLHSLRRRETTTSEKKSKSRMEAINEIIARSQTQAQSMLASTGYYDGAASPVQGLISPRGRVHYSPEDFGNDGMSPIRMHGYIPTTPPSRHSPNRPSP